LLEDLTDTHFQTAQETAPDRSSSEAAVAALARIHARWWRSSEVGVSVGKVFDQSWLARFVDDLERSVDLFINEVGTDLTSDVLDALQLMVRNAENIWGRLTVREGLTVTHGDVHWWNFMFPLDPRDVVRVIDWQLWHIDLGARDLAFLLALGGFAETRPDIEADLLHVYRETLDECGISLTADQLFEDYRMSAIRNLNVAVIFRGQGKHPSTWQTALSRAYASYRRLKCEELLS
jgi:thiamine kinase-like enzyme